MRVHVISDVHGRAGALRTAGAGADALFCLGDLLLFVDYADEARGIFAELFGADPLADFAGAFGALLDGELLEVTATAIRPTPRGMFYADSIAALLAWRQIAARRQGMPPRLAAVQPKDAEARRPSVNDNGRGYM